MENLKKVTWYNLPVVANDNFEKLENAVDALEVNAVIEPQSNITSIGTTTNITAVPASFSDLASVQSYLAGANMVPNIEVRIDNLESKVNAILTALRAAGILEV